MLDSFLEVLAKNETDRQQSVKLASDLMRLPNETLFALATGRAKLAFGYGDDWLDKYKDSPLFEQALALEKADLESEIAREQANTSQPDMSQFFKTQEQIRLQKKMLDLQLIESQEKDGLQVQDGGKLPETITPTAQGAGALGDVAAEGAQQGEAGKMAMANFQKAALDMGALKGLGTTALNYAKKNPGKAGAIAGGVLGAGVGAATASRDPQTGEKHWIRGALGGAAGGAALGGAAGHVGMGVGKRVARGQGLGEAVSNYGTQVKREGQVAMGKLQKAVGGEKAPATAAAAPTPKPAVPAAPPVPGEGGSVHVPLEEHQIMDPALGARQAQEQRFQNIMNTAGTAHMAPIPQLKAAEARFKLAAAQLGV